MATKVIGKIVLFEALDQDKLTSLLAGPDTILLQIEQTYIKANKPQQLAVVLPTQFNDVTIDYIDAFKKFIDITTWNIQEDAIIWNVVFDGVDEFDLTASYVRDDKDTSGMLKSLTTGTELKAIFYTPSFEGQVATEITLPYKQAISSGDISALLAVGIDINLGHTGSLFSIASSVNPFKVEFFKPDGVLVDYVIDFNYKNQTITI